MTTSNEKLDAVDSGKKTSQSGEPVWVQCEGFRCLAFQDKQGVWRAFYDRSKLPGPVKVIPNPHGH
jgi:hypothetical protein